MTCAREADDSRTSFVTAITGISHERLQVAHRWVSYLMFASALIHTVGLGVVGHHAGMPVDWTEVYCASGAWGSADNADWTGLIAFIAQIWLTFASVGPLRRIGYEWFKKTHFVAGVVFIVRRATVSMR